MQSFSELVDVTRLDDAEYNEQLRTRGSTYPSRAAIKR